MLTYAPDESGRLHHIDAVKTGKACGCFCPECHTQLIAKNCGKMQEHHFAHLNGLECPHAGETVLHMLTKEVLAESKRLWIPDYSQGILTFDTIVTEETFAGKRRADVIGVKGNRRLVIEIKVSHAVDEQKRQDIINAHESCIEIDLSTWTSDVTRENIAEALLHPSNFGVNIQWINAPVLDEMRRRREEARRQREKEFAEEVERDKRRIEQRFEGHVLPWDECKFCHHHSNWIDFLKTGKFEYDHTDYDHEITFKNKRWYKPKCKWNAKHINLFGDENGAEHILCKCPYHHNANIFVVDAEGQKKIVIDNRAGGRAAFFRTFQPGRFELPPDTSVVIWSSRSWSKPDAAFYKKEEEKW